MSILKKIALIWGIIIGVMLYFGSVVWLVSMLPAGVDFFAFLTICIGSFATLFVFLDHYDYM